MTKQSTTPPVARIVTHETPGPGPWVLQAACADLPTRYFFSDDPAGTDLALAVCRPCPVRDDCAAYALAIPILDGVWGGLTEADRRRIVRRRARHTQDGSRTAGQAGAPLPTGTASDALRCR
jgi:WhiB family redox-sensing transcriptional regulator